MIAGIIIVVVWLLCGWKGYINLRADARKHDIWNVSDRALGLLFTVIGGPLFLFISWIVCSGIRWDKKSSW